VRKVTPRTIAAIGGGYVLATILMRRRVDERADRRVNAHYSPEDFFMIGTS
jgi:hypothetical protein